MYKIKRISNNRIELGFEIPKEEFNKFYSLAEKKLAKNIELNGFRKGTVPVEMARPYLNQQTILNEAAKLTIYKNFYEAIQKEKLEPVEMPEIQILKIAPNNPFEFKIISDVIPDFKLCDYKKIKIKKQTIEVSHSEIEEILKDIAEKRARIQPVDRPAQINDLVNIDFKLTIDNQPLKGNEGKNLNFILGKGGFIEGIEENIKGMKKNEKKIFNLTIPNNYFQKEIRGKNATIEIILNEINERILPEINDEFARQLGNFENLESLKKNIKEGRLQEKEEEEKERLSIEIINYLTKETKIDIPQSLIKKEIASILEELKYNVETLGKMNFADYLNKINKNERIIEQELKPEAEKRVKVNLILRKIAEIEKIEPSEEEVENKVNNILRRFSSVQQAKENIDIEQIINYSKIVITNEKVLNYLISISAV